MALNMARPTKHPKTGVYYLRRRVPDALRPIVGKLEELQSLGTKDPIEAKIRHAEASAALEKKWTNLRTGKRTLTEREAHELVYAPVYDWAQANRDSLTFWNPTVGSELFTDRPYVPLADEQLDAAYFDRIAMERFCRESAAKILQEAGLVDLDEVSHTRVHRAFGKTVQQAVLDPYEVREWSGVAPYPRQNKRLTLPPTPVRMASLVEGWAKERKPKAKTVSENTRAMKELTVFVGHEEAARLTPKDFARWKAYLIDHGLRPSTVKLTKLDPLKTILQWAVDNSLLPTNPAARAAVGMKIKSATPVRGFSDEEAVTILQAAQTEKNAVLRWIPLLACYTGCRLSELCQLRTNDLVLIEGVLCIRLAPEAGSLKNRGSERLIPPHPAVIASGFPVFVQGLKAGPIFSGLRPDRFGNRGGTAGAIIGKWVRGLGLVDKRLSPSHSWRHRFKTLCRVHEVPVDIADALTGHSRAGVAARYGAYPVATLHRAICHLPEVDIKPRGP